MSTMIRVRSLRQTCNACPSSWKGETEEGESFYIRYRWGYLTLVFPEHKENPEVYGEQIGDDLDGVLGETEMRQHLRGILSFEEVLL